MTRKKDRIPIVLDTNVLVANYLSTNPESANVITIRLWRERKLQMIVSDEITHEYAEVLAELNMPKKLVTSFLTSLNESGTVSHVNLGKRLIDSRDPKDNPFLSTAATGRAKYLITNDNDLLEIPEVKKRRYKFKILTPAQFLRAFS